MRWVQNQIHHFNGDKDKVLLFGESAGAISVCAHLVSPQSAGLFQAAIMESGTPSALEHDYANTRITVPYLQAAHCAPNGTGTASTNGTGTAGTAAVLECLQAAPLATLQSAAEIAVPTHPSPSDPLSKLSWLPVVDGERGGLPAHPQALLRQGKFYKGVRLLAGTNTNEATIFIFPFYGTNENDQINAGGLNVSRYVEAATSLLANRLQPGQPTWGVTHGPEV